MAAGEREYQNPLANWSDARLIAAEFERSVPPTGAVQAEMMRRLKDAMKESEESANLLGERISRLTLWLLIFTIAICGLTVVLVVAELGLLKRLLG